MKLKPHTLLIYMLALTPFLGAKSKKGEVWSISSESDWKENISSSEGLTIENDMVFPAEKSATFKTKMKTFDKKTALNTLTIDQSSLWQNWNPIPNLGPENLNDAPILLTMGPDNYWMFGRYGNDKKTREFKGEKATLEGFDIPLLTTPYSNQYNAPGGLKPNKGGYNAWQSKDMVNWVHHGSVTETFSKWSTTAEYVNGKVYLYYDFPNDQDPHVYVDKDLTDGEPGENMGMAFADPSDGSDCGIIRDLDGKFHLILENWSPIKAQTHSWDSPLASHAVSESGLKDFKLVKPAVDERTEPTGEFAEYAHPHWHKEAPDRFPAKVSDIDVPQHNIKKGEKRAFAKYEIHTPEQDAYGDWAPICIGGQYYLFGDFDPAHGKGRGGMSVAWFTSSSIDKQFTFCDNIGNGHPDPDVCFAEGKFYLATQMETDYVSDGPWVEKVTARVGVDTNKDGKADTWSDWKELKEKYDYIKGFSKQIKKIPASLDLSDLPKGYGFQLEFKIEDTTENKSKPMLDKISINFK